MQRWEFYEKEFVKTRTRKLLVPSTIGLFVFQWILGYYNMAISHAFDIMFNSMPDTVPLAVKNIIVYFSMVMSGTGVLWFIQMLWLFSLLLVLIRKIEKDRLYHVCEKVNVIALLLLGIPVCGAAQILNVPVICIYRFGIYGICFLIGYFVLSHEQVVERLSKYWLPLSLIAVLTGICYTIFYFGENYAVDPVRNSHFFLFLCLDRIICHWRHALII